MARKSLLIWISLWYFAGTAVWAGTPGQDPAQKRPTSIERQRTEIPYREGTFVLISDYQERLDGNRYIASGNVVITYREIKITCDRAEYNEATKEGFTTGRTRFSQGSQWLECSRAEFNLADQTGTFYDASGYTDQAFLLGGSTVRKTGRDTYVVDQGFLTACPEKRPKWAFSVGSARIQVDRTARLRKVVFEIKGVPAFYFPYLIVPMENKKRSSGFLPFHTGNSSSKGREFSLGYFQTLGRSADLTLYGNYFSLRGMGYGGIFRARPNTRTSLDVQAYAVDDRQGQGGAQLVVDGTTQFANGFRAVAGVNITTNFQFRQAFMDAFRSATVSQEQSILFATRNGGSFAANFEFERDEVRFPIRSLVIRKSPSLEFLSLGQPLGRLPLVLTFRGAAEGMSRSDSVIETPRIVQRLDLFPSLALRLPSLAGFSLIPSVGVRETYYSARIADPEDPVVVAEPLHRQYTQFEIDLRTPQLERNFHTGWLGDFSHLIEPGVTYRRIHGIKDMRETIRFDDEDAIADTNEVEYGIVNRLIRRKTSEPGLIQDYELLSFRIAQKYYFDPTFGGAFLQGEPNLFYPLNTLTGFSATGIVRNISPLSMSLRLTPRQGFSYDVRADYDTKLYRLRDSSITAFLQKNRLMVAGTYFKTNILERGNFEANHIQGQVGYGNPNDMGFSASLSLSYNLKTRNLLNSNSRLYYGWNCCGVALEFQQFDLGLRIESRFTFSFSLKGIGNFGNLKRPESLF